MVQSCDPAFSLPSGSHNSKFQRSVQRKNMQTAPQTNVNLNVHLVSHGTTIKPRTESTRRSALAFRPEVNRKRTKLGLLWKLHVNNAHSSGLSLRSFVNHDCAWAAASLHMPKLGISQTAKGNSNIPHSNAKRKDWAVMKCAPLHSDLAQFKSPSQQGDT